MSKKRVLIVEDDEDIRESLRDMLEIEGYSVLEAKNGEEGLRQLQHDQKPHCILLDLMMPVMSGPEFLVEMRKSAEYADVPVFVVSAVADRKLANLDGVVGYLKKPVDIDALLDAISGCLKTMS